MKPGRELDALIAVQIMGWEQFECEFTAIPMWLSPDGDEYAESETFFSLIAYSTDIAVAWGVVEKIRSAQVGPELPVKAAFQVMASPYDSVYFAGWLVYDEDTFYHWSCGSTAPMAICLAALAAVKAGNSAT